MVATGPCIQGSPGVTGMSGPNYIGASGASPYWGIPSGSAIYGVTGMAYGVTGMAFGYTGPGLGYDQSQTLSNEDVEIIFDVQNEDEAIKVSGSIRQIALLILQEAQEIRERSTYTYNGKSYAPENVTWGPFIFDASQSFKAGMRPSSRAKYSIKELVTINKILQELEKLQEMKAFW